MPLGAGDAVGHCRGGRKGLGGGGRAPREDFSLGGFCLPFLGSARSRRGRGCSRQQRPVPSLGPELLAEHRNRRRRPPRPQPRGCQPALPCSRRS